MKPEEFQLHESVEDTHWWFRARREILLALLHRFHPDLSQANLLEIGCGTGGNLRFFSRSLARVTGQDIDPLAIDLAKRRVAGELFLGDFRELLADRNREFHVILLLDVLEHIADDQAFLQNLAGSMAPGGLLVLTVPAHPFLWSGHDLALGHQRRYTPRELRRLLASTPLHVLFASPMNCCLFLPIAVIRLLRSLLPQGQAARSDLHLPSPWINQLLYLLFVTERFWLQYFTLPFGISHVIIAVAPSVAT